MPNARRYRGLIPLLLIMLTASLGSCADKAAPAPAAVVRVTPRIIRSLPHDTLAFTQGLLLYNGLLYESTGAPRGRVSDLRVLDPHTGTIVRRVPVPEVFAEGLAEMGGALLQLSWRRGVAIQYDPVELRPLARIRYRGEGWGLTADGSRYYMSNGSDTLFVRDRQFKTVKRIPITYRGKPLTRLNELEYARGRIYANVWYSDYLFEIDPETGRVLRLIDCTALVAQAGTRSQDQVLNGIAYVRRRDTFYLTGKDWPLLFEVRITAP